MNATQFFKVTALLTLFAIMAALFSGCRAETAEEGKPVITIGIQLPITGELGALGTSMKNGALLAMREINSETEKSARLELTIEDDQCDQALAVSAYNRLTARKDIQAVVGPACSTPFLAVAAIAEKEKIVVVSPSATSTRISPAGDFVFRTATSDTLRMQKLAEFAYSVLPNKKIAVMYLNNDYGISAKDDFIKKLEELGGKVVLSEGFNAHTNDFRAKLQRVKNSRADALFQVSYGESSGLIYAQAKELNLSSTLFSGYEAPDDGQIYDTAREGHNGVYYAVAAAPDKSFREAYKAEFGEEPLTYAAETYDAVKLIALAMQKGALTGEEIKNALYEIKDYQGASGTFSIDEKGDVHKSFNLIRIENNVPKVLREL